MKFEELNLQNETLQALNNNNKYEANRSQEVVINAVNSEQDTVFKSGKSDEETSTFAIAAIDQAHKTESEEGTQTLILLNDDEALKAVHAKINNLQSDIDSVLIEAGSPDDAQIDEIGEGHALVIAHPGRLQAILKKNRYIFRDLKLLILGQLHKMVSAEQADSLNSIKKRILSSFTTIAGTGSYEGETKKIAQSFLDQPKVKGFGPPPPPEISEQLKQTYINVPPRMKISTLMAHLNNTEKGRCVIFTNSKRGTDRLYRILKKQRMKAVSLHYKLSDERRAQRFANFANGNVQYLLVSDISAAQLDTNGVTQVINYDVPANADEYRYRTSLVNSGNSSQIISLVSKQDQGDIKQLQKELGATPEEIPLPNKVKQKLKERKQKKDSNGRKSHQQQDDELELPQPTYEQLSGGRKGPQNEDEQGIVTFFKKLFS